MFLFFRFWGTVGIFYTFFWLEIQRSKKSLDKTFFLKKLQISRAGLVWYFGKPVPVGAAVRRPVLLQQYLTWIHLEKLLGFLFT